MQQVRWHDDAQGGGVLEIHEATTRPGPAVQLELIRSSDDDRLAAFWVTADGMDLGLAVVGLA